MAKLAIIGAGKVGGALGQGWAKGGHAIIYGVPTPADPKHAGTAKAAGNARVEAVAAAVDAADVIVLATPWEAAPAAIAACGDLTGRVLIDVTNPFRFGPDGLELALGFSTSAGEQIARWRAARRWSRR